MLGKQFNGSDYAHWMALGTKGTPASQDAVARLSGALKRQLGHIVGTRFGMERKQDEVVRYGPVLLPYAAPRYAGAHRHWQGDAYPIVSKPLSDLQLGKPVCVTST